MKYGMQSPLLTAPEFQDLMDSTSFFLQKFIHGKKLEEFPFNFSFIYLIPKVATSHSFEDFRPINLVGSVYKILSRVLARRLSKYLNEVIGESQRLYQKCINEAIVLKADFKKAYDSH
ncbi:hypothetical protein GQ457_04G020940 [Hibiscus cannabinus]